MSTINQPTLCVGVDITWWGGSRHNRASRRETIVAIRLGADATIQIKSVDLGPVPNPSGGDNGQPNYDRDGSYLVDALMETIDAISTPGERVVVALDAPLEARTRVGQPPRIKAAKKGEPMGSTWREAETALSQYARDLPKETRAGWNRDLRVQAGSPIPPRITCVLDQLGARGFEIVRSSEQKPTRGIIEIFPSQAIWGLGTMGHYSKASSKDVRVYKSKKDKVMTEEAAFETACLPLGGFAGVLCGEGGLDALLVATWTSALARNAVACSTGKKPGEIHKGKGFDDPIDSGIAALTCVAYAMGRYHIFGDGTDGTIVGPGVLLDLA